MKWSEYPDKNSLDTAAGTKDISLRNSAGEVVVAATGTCLFDYTKLYGPIRYMADVTINGNTEHIVSKENKYDMVLHANPGDKIKVEGYYAFEHGSFTSNKISKEATVTATITIPKNASQAEMETWCNRYDFVTFKTETTSDPALLNKKYKVVDQTGSELSQGQSINVENSGFRLTVTYYVERDHILNLVTSSLDGGKSIRISANSEGDPITWYYGGMPGFISASDEGMSIIFSVTGQPDDDYEFVVTCESDYKTAQITIYVNYDEASGTVTLYG